MSAFVAWMPDEDTRAGFGELQSALGRACPGMGQRWWPTDRLHMTLRYLGERIDGEQLASALRELAAIATGTARLQLDFVRIEYWPWAGVLVAVPSPSRELEHLFARIEAAMQGCGFRPESREPRPHVTLAHLARPPPAPVADRAGALLPAPTLDRIDLMRNANGGGYESLCRLPLQGLA